MKEKKIIISGGGTAGHIYPALAVGNKLKENDASLQLTYVGTHRKLEKNIMEHHKVGFIPLKIEGLKGKGLRTIKSLFLLPFSFLKSFSILRRIRPDLVIGMGGYSSGPIVLLASWMKIPTLILEQNLYPGFTNRMLVPWVRKAVVAFKGSLSYFKGKGIFIGNPVREEFYNLSPKARNAKLAILIFGGSQGSHFLNKGITAALPLLKEEKASLRIYHQTGEKDLEWVKENYAQNGFKEVTVAPYFLDMASYFQKSDLIISRAGATTIAEFIASQKASILIPFSQAADNHQVLNAGELEKINGAEIILEEEFTPELLVEKIFDLLHNREKIARMEKNIARIKTEKVTEKISDLCFKLLETGRKE
ncbi:MAG: undecaprenyldiphospho-muramoylpentapeptide beta-N-acetylglucosaminyltransferase [Candidatus Aminicenantes bacterium]|nr:undecaprenyldiphospho-muramoylpentapeptide beta-N-acetylglucosaminyltransferase [Candidatus Aminicenantes bacterium]